MAKHAETVLPIVLGTAYGPTLLIPRLLNVSHEATIFAEEAPPEPATIPVRKFDTSSSVNFASAMACSIAM